MIVVDASAFVAILNREPNWETYHAWLAQRDEPAVTHAVTLLEAVNVLARLTPRALAEARVSEYLERHNIAILPIDAEIGRLARDAYAQFGKGQGHRAQLNLGDCFSHAVATKYAAILLFVGDDFVATGMSSALASP